jgi:Icc protein
MRILIAQISDCHLPAKREQTYRGINPYRCLQALIPKVKALKPGLLLATGDLSEDGSRLSYQALKEIFRPLGVPVLALPGNHDDPELLSEVFPGSPVNTIGVSTHGAWKIIRLNSCLPGKPEGRLGETSLAALERFLKQHTDSPILIALHHQPIDIGSPWIDKYRLFGSQAFLSLIDQNPNIRAVTWGHVHQVFESDRNGTHMLGCPSSAINGRTIAPRFTPDTIGPACRWLELREDKTLLSGIIQARGK